MTGYVLSPAARADLEGIWDYTARTWDALVNGTRRGGRIDDIRPGYHKLAVGSHFPFYRLADPDLIDIVRILHRRMDVPSCLAEQ